MFGLSVDHLVVLLVAALFILGPERLPGAAAWLGQSLSRIRGFASGAQEQLRAEIGTDFDELRKPLQELGSLRKLDLNSAVARLLVDDTPPPSVSPAPTTTPAIGRAPSPVSQATFDTEAT